jgi:serpin B
VSNPVLLGGEQEAALERASKATFVKRWRRALTMACLGALLGLCFCGPMSGKAVSVQGPSSAPSPLAAAEAGFATDLYGQLAGTKGNVIFSPSSVWAVLAMLLIGADGPTATQLRSALHLTGVTDNEVVAAAAALGQQVTPLAEDPQNGVLTTNELWPRQGHPVNPRFVEALRQGWAATVQEIAFGNPTQAATTIDEAVSAATHGLIPRLLSAQVLTPPPELVVTDAVYLHATWAYPFDPNETAPAPFYGNTTTTVATMNETAQFGYAREAGYQIIVLPYAGGRLEMTILLPNGDLAPLQRELERRGLTDLASGTQPTNVALSLPRFTVSSQQSLNRYLKLLGITDAFDPATADFAGIGPKPLFLSDVVHQAVVKVAEKGTIAAAATAAVGGLGAAGPPPATVFVAVNRPFLFAITDRATGTPFFFGRVESP